MCRDALRGPVVVCASCQNQVHPHCALAYMQDAICEKWFGEYRRAEAQRHQHQAAARGLGLLGARGSDALGTALGAVGDASAAASLFFVHGVHAGARSTWAGGVINTPAGGLQTPAAALQTAVPRPASLPPPLPADVTPAVPQAPSASEGAGARAREGGRCRTDSRTSRTRSGPWRNS